MDMKMEMTRMLEMRKIWALHLISPRICYAEEEAFVAFHKETMRLLFEALSSDQSTIDLLHAKECVSMDVFNDLNWEQAQVISSTVRIANPSGGLTPENEDMIFRLQAGMYFWFINKKDATHIESITPVINKSIYPPDSCFSVAVYRWDVPELEVYSTSPFELGCLFGIGWKLARNILWMKQRGRELCRLFPEIDSKVHWRGQCMKFAAKGAFWGEEDKWL